MTPIFCIKAEIQINLPFGDNITTIKVDNYSRILFQNVNSLEMSTGQHTLENTCDGIGSYERDIACLAETNTRWKHYLGESILRSTSKHHWKHFYITTSETDLPEAALYKPGGTAIITQQPLCNGIINSGQDPHELGRWFYIIISGRDNSIITIISAYRIFDISVQTVGLITNTKQQWNILKERDQEHEDNRHKTIIDISTFINSLTQQNNEVLLGIDSNEPNILYNKGVSQLLQRTKLIDAIDEFHGLYKVPNTYIQGRHRVDFFLSTKYISTFIDRSGITSFNEVTTSNHRGKFIDLRLRDFLKTSYASISNASSRTLQSTNTKSVVKYKQHLKPFLIINRF